MIAVLLALAVTTAAPADHDRVRVDVGGVMSGPARLEVDLTTGLATDAGQGGGDAAGVRTEDVPITASRTVTAQEAATLRSLGEAVLREGINTPSRGRPGEPDFCMPNLDLIKTMTVSLGGSTRHDYLVCGGSAAARKLEEAINCAVHPDLKSCKPQ